METSHNTLKLAQNNGNKSQHNRKKPQHNKIRTPQQKQTAKLAKNNEISLLCCGDFIVLCTTVVTGQLFILIHIPNYFFV